MFSLLRTGQKRKRDHDTASAKPRPVLNSSRLKPEAAAAHNLEIPTLLLIDERLLQHIFTLVLQLADPITVTATGMLLPDPSQRELSLLCVSKKTRQLARPIFYSANDFDMQVEKFDMQSLLPWWQRASTLRQAATSPKTIATVADKKKYKSKLQQKMADFQQKYNASHDPVQPASSDTSVSITLAYTPHWENLQAWLQLYHANQLPRYQAPVSDLLSVLESQDEQKFLEGVSLVFDKVAAYGDYEWEVVELGLESERGHLAHQDSRWKVEGDAFGKEDEEEGEAVLRIEDRHSTEAIICAGQEAVEAALTIESAHTTEAMTAPEPNTHPEQHSQASTSDPPLLRSPAKSFDLPDYESEQHEEDYNDAQNEQAFEEYLSSPAAKYEHRALAQSQYYTAPEEAVATPAVKKRKIGSSGGRRFGKGWDGEGPQTPIELD